MPIDPTTLSQLIAGGESQTLEFKEQLPQQMRDLAKEFAAFATSNDGLVLVGVSDGGTVVGLDDLGDLKKRDELRGRVIGTCTNTVKPPIMPSVEFVEIDGRWIVVIDVKAGAAPVYYANNVPMLRHLTSSRPAEPQEVIDHVLAWKGAGEKPLSEEEVFLGELLPMLNSVMVATGEVEEREVNPWLDSLRYEFEAYATEARRLLLKVPSSLGSLPTQLQEMAEQLNNAAHQDMGIGWGWDEYVEAAQAALKVATAIKDELYGDKLASERNVAFVERSFNEECSALAQLVARAESLTNRRMSELQSSAGDHGRALLMALTYDIGFKDASTRKRIIDQARLLREVATRSVYMDGGQSVREIVSAITGAHEELSKIQGELSADPKG